MTLSLNKKDILKYVFIISIFLLVILFVFTVYDKISVLVDRAEYFIFPGKKIAEYEKLTSELIALYGSGRIEYYQAESGTDESSARAYPGGEVISREGVVSGNYIYIPSINISAPIVTGTSTDEKTILTQLKNGALMYPGSSLPGDGGSTVIIGHSSSNLPWQKYSSIFSSLPKLSKGDMVIINYNGRKYSYIVDGKIIGSVSVLSGQSIKGDLVLGTCWPIGTDEQRIIITASLAPST
ncbi:MAG: hypothetical protein A2651_01810 [Candidatus Yanofskybacteria bacterium RIFCSPHIGHO2_01_FULL_42_12]|uniref:Sortase n=1 Tax=Candidatus Yanofskybacteria bacterium RIFCSPLOWO2_01_FULL_42_49 TaxID=1802694 RepID=A0A1F8GBQ8_9BACT|nr:MAG: hypothetical protein A2651_01810 [Candidatus Yanofskybacteria bacterium RIFCSPHIGHO2_01_FULL_42_12]OGN22470.1 MAG: hypothetical protein A2918_01770 [Candidatus Yanofskybacteria bacterium RIFCSPLOWO2_01_FULL_42_49]